MNYWSYRIHRAGYKAGDPIFVAEYVTEISSESVKKDLANHHSRLRDHLTYFSRIDAEEFAQKFALEAEQLLAGLAACSDCIFASVSACLFKRLPHSNAMLQLLGRYRVRLPPMSAFDFG